MARKKGGERNLETEKYLRHVYQMKCLHINYDSNNPTVFKTIKTNRML